MLQVPVTRLRATSDPPVLPPSANMPKHEPKGKKIKNSCIPARPLLVHQQDSYTRLNVNNFPHLGKSENIEISILSYNIFIRPPLIKNNASDFKDQRLQDFLQVMDRFHIIGLQEMFSSFSFRTKEFIRLAYSKGFYYHLRSKHRIISSYLVDGGLLLLSKYPIEASDHKTYRHGRQSDGLAAKGVLYAKIQIDTRPDASIHVFLTHTQASYINDTHLKLPVVRAAQLKQLSLFIQKKTCADRLPVVLLGDLNVNGRRSAESNEDSDEYLFLMETLNNPRYRTRDLLKEVYGGQPITFADIREDGGKILPRETQLTDRNELCSRQRLDYIIYLEPKENENEDPPRTCPFEAKRESTRVEEFSVERKPYTQLSDHYGVSTSLKFYRDRCQERHTLKPSINLPIPI